MLHWREKSVQLIKVLKHLSLFLEYFHLTCDWRPVWLQLSQELCPFNNKYQMHHYWTEAVIVLQCFPVQTKSWSLCFLWLFFLGWVAVILLFWWDWLLFSIKAACSNLGQFFWFFGGFSQTCVVKFSYIFSYIYIFFIYIYFKRYSNELLSYKPYALLQEYVSILPGEKTNAVVTFCTCSFIFPQNSKII